MCVSTFSSGTHIVHRVHILKDTYHEETFHEETFHEETFHEETFHEETFHEETNHEETFHEETYHEAFCVEVSHLFFFTSHTHNIFSLHLPGEKDRVYLPGHLHSQV